MEPEQIREKLAEMSIPKFVLTSQEVEGFRSILQDFQERVFTI